VITLFLVLAVDILQVEQGKENKQKAANETKGQQKQATIRD
jgi:hypothetical protein